MLVILLVSTNTAINYKKSSHYSGAANLLCTKQSAMACIQFILKAKANNKGHFLSKTPNIKVFKVKMSSWSVLE